MLTLWDQMVSFFISAFRFPGLGWSPILISVALALVFGALWLFAYRPPLKNKSVLLAIAAASALVTWGAIAFVQVPLQTWSGQGLLHFWDILTISRWLLLAGIPTVLISGFVQEAAKLAPLLLVKSRSRGVFNANTGLVLGAIAGAGFGIFEAVWTLNSAFASGLSWQTFQIEGLGALLPLADRLFAVGFHMAVSALAGYGLATGRGWRFYLLAATLHGAANYSTVLVQKGAMGTTAMEICLAGFAVLLCAVVLLLRWHMAHSCSQAESSEMERGPTLEALKS
jgi:RsiW-degrading membrane proteinase PrsW (M82 family)